MNLCCCLLQISECKANQNTNMCATALTGQEILSLSQALFILKGLTAPLAQGSRGRSRAVRSFSCSGDAYFLTAAPKGANAKAAILKNCLPKGIPTMVMHHKTPFTAAVTAISQPKISTQSTFSSTLPAPAAV